jgi:hypothetical protein
MKSNSKTMTQVSGESHGCLARCLMGIVLLIAMTAALLATSCSANREKIDDGTNPMSADSGLLSNGFLSLDALGQAAVNGLNHGSYDELRKLMVTKEEFRDVIFPRTPEKLRSGMTWEDGWMRNDFDSESAINRVLGGYGGKNLHFLYTHVRDSTETSVFPGKTTWRDVRIVAEMPGAEKPINLRFLNVVQMVGGRCKVVAFHK